jgi:hypothetical protein
MPDFRTLLSKPADQIEKPKPLPAGTYNGVISKFEFGESRDKKTPYVRFHFALQSAGDDVLANYADQLAKIDLAKKQLRRDFYITDDALYRLKDFAESCGQSTSGRTLNEVIPLLQNSAVLISVTQRNSDDGKDVFNDVGEVKGV